MAPATKESEHIAFLLEVLKHASEFEPDWHSVAANNGINAGYNAQRRFKAIIEKYGYNCEGGKKVIGGPKDANAVAAAAVLVASGATKRKYKRRAPADEEEECAPVIKKMKKDDKDDDEGGAGNGVEESAAVVAAV